MNRIVLLSCLTFALSGCATMYQSMGIASSADLAARDEKIAALQGKVDSFSEDAKQVKADAKLAADKAAEVEGLMKDLQGKVDQLPQETLKKLSEILSKAVAQTN